VDGKGNITVDSDPVREVLDYASSASSPTCRAKPSPTMTRVNNKAYVAGSAALIWNPPSAWAVAKRDAPAIAADTWHFPNPRARSVDFSRIALFLGHLAMGKEQAGAEDLLAFVSQREVVTKLSVPAAGYDIPPFMSMADLPVWADIEPPKGTLYNYPVRPHHDAEYYIVGSSAPPDIGVQIWSQYMIPGMAARIVSGHTPKQVIDWAKRELEGIRR
jgi:hypothetical protein